MGGLRTERQLERRWLGQRENEDLTWVPHGQEPPPLPVSLTGWSHDRSSQEPH